MNHHKPSRGFDSWTREELVEISRRAGVSSGRSRRRKRRRIDREKVRMQAREEYIHEMVVGIRAEAKRIKASAGFQQSNRSDMQ